MLCERMWSGMTSTQSTPMSTEIIRKAIEKISDMPTAHSEPLLFFGNKAIVEAAKKLHNLLTDRQVVFVENDSIDPDKVIQIIDEKMKDMILESLREGVKTDE